MADRTLKVTDPRMTGDEIRGWQDTLNRQMRTWQIDHRITADGDYGVQTRDLTATVMFGLGLDPAHMAQGLTPELRIKIRNKDLSVKERALFTARAAWRAKLRKRYEHAVVASPLSKILSSSWGFHPPVHDGVDLICPPNAAGFAICTGTILRADGGGWWGKGAPSAAVAARGDGVVVLRCEVDVGPFRKGLRFCYGHAEHPSVKVGDHVGAGELLCRAGLANAWHFHFMVNARDDDRGLGDRDPMPFVNYALRHG